MAQTAVKVPSSSPYRYLLGEEAPKYRDNFNRHSFTFEHRLAGHPLFEMPRLIKLAYDVRRHPDARYDEVYFDMGDIPITQRWGDTPKPQISPEEALERIQSAGAWMLIRRAELDPEYRIVLDECMGEIKRLLDVDLDRVMYVKNAIVFITSPRRITTYHIDRECNFLLQVSGDKSISVFDKTDRAVLPDEELERYWAVDNNAALYKPHLQDRANQYPLGPNQGVHIPVNAPHWVQNGDLPSVALSVNFEFKSRKRSDVYRANYYLRKLGLEPMPPGQSELRDGVKRTMIMPVVRRARTLKHGLRDRVSAVTGKGKDDR